MGENNASFSRKFVTGELHFGAWYAISKAVGFANTFLIISSLTVYQYGVFQLFLAGYGMAVVLISLGAESVQNDIARAIGEKNEPRAKKLFYEYNSYRLIVASALWAVGFFGASFLARWYQPDFIAMVRVISFMFFVDALILVAKMLLSSRLEFKVAASRGTSGKLFQFTILAYFFFFATLGTREALIAFVLGSFASLIILAPALMRSLSIWKGIAAAPGHLVLDVIQRFGRWELSSQVFNKISNNIHPWLIKFFVGTEAVGIFSAAVALVDVVKSLIASSTLTSLLPRNVGNIERMRAVLVYGIKYSLWFGTALMIGAGIAGSVAITVIIPHYALAIPFFLGLLLQVPFYPAATLVSYYLTTYRHQKLLFGIAFTKGFSLAGLFVSLLPTIGLAGAVVGRVAVTIVSFAITLWLLMVREPQLGFTARTLTTFGEQDRIILRTLWKDFRVSLKSKLGHLWRRQTRK